MHYHAILWLYERQKHKKRKTKRKVYHLIAAHFRAFFRACWLGRKDWPDWRRISEHYCALSYKIWLKCTNNEAHFSYSNLYKMRQQIIAYIRTKSDSDVSRIYLSHIRMSDLAPFFNTKVLTKTCHIMANFTWKLIKCWHPYNSACSKNIIIWFSPHSLPSDALLQSDKFMTYTAPAFDHQTKFDSYTK